MLPRSGLNLRAPSIVTRALVLFLAMTPSLSQSRTSPHATVPTHPEPSAEAELKKRIVATQTAQASGSPEAVALANEKLIALALRELGQLRLLEAAYPQAIQLYRQAVSFEDVPDTRVDLAIAELQANHNDEAISDADKALASSPRNSRAISLRGRAFIKKHDYAKAAEALQKSLDLSPDLETYYSLGICLLQTKNPQDKGRASAAFQQMIKMAGDSGSLHVLFGRAYRDSGDMPKAIAEFQRAIALDPQAPHAHFFLGLAKMAVNEWKSTPEVKSELEKELRNYPRDYLANYMLGFIASGERQYEVSDRYLKTSVEVNPDAPEPWLYMGLNAYAQNDLKRAEEMFRQAIKLTGNDEARSNFQIRRAYVDLGRILSNSGRIEESEIYLTKARDLQNKTMQQSQQNVTAIAVAGGAGAAAAIVPLSPQSENQEAPLPLNNANPFDRVDASVVARANLTTSQRAAADSQEDRLRSILGLAFNDLATSEAVRRQYSAALGHYQEAEHWDAHIPGLAKNLGLSAFRSNNYPEAIRGLSRALEEAPNDAPVRALLGMSYYGAEKYMEAANTFSPLAEKGMQDSSVGYAWASSLVHLGDLKRAADVLREYEKTNRSDDALLLIGKLWIEIGDYNQSASVMHEALQSNPALLKAHYFAGQAYLREEQWPEAEKEFQAELSLNPSDTDAKYNLGFVYAQQSRIDDAAKLFQEVIASDPNQGNAQYQLGKIYLDRGKLPEAVAHLEAATRLSPQRDYMHYQLQAAYRKQSRLADADRELAIYKDLKTKQREQSPIPQQNR
jgi:tetratricopeptide (TPR) repeat protein